MKNNKAESLKRAREIKQKNEKRRKRAAGKLRGRMAELKNKRAEQDNGFNRLSARTHGKMEALGANLRFSLTLRIALSYCGKLFSQTIPILILFTLLFSVVSYHSLDVQLADVIADIPAAAGEYGVGETRLYGLTATVSDGYNEEKNLIIAAAKDVKNAFTNGLFDEKATMLITRPKTAGEKTYTVAALFDVTRQRTLYLWLAGAMLFFDLMRAMRFLQDRRRLDKTVLQPIYEIAEIAKTLSATNLSARINLQGMKNELRDLSAVINSMLDRIELSYNSQKQFVSDASHELRTPIAVIQGYADLLSRWGKEDKDILNEGITAISAEASNMKELVESLLFLARHDKKTLHMELSTFNMRDLVATLQKEMQMVAPAYTILTDKLESSLIYADQGMVKQALRVLLDNAVKYTPSGGTITLSCEHMPDGCLTTVSDTGVGISKEDLPRIFDRFYRSDEARKREGGGHGLGLSIARIIVLSHGGRITVRSKPGVGTSFAVFFPEKTKTSDEETPAIKKEA